MERSGDAEPLLQGGQEHGGEPRCLCPAALPSRDVPQSQTCQCGRASRATVEPGSCQDFAASSGAEPSSPTRFLAAVDETAGTREVWGFTRSATFLVSPSPRWLDFISRRPSPRPQTCWRSGSAR